MAGLEMRFFVLEPKGKDVYARASREALKRYAEVIKDKNCELCADILLWVKDLEDQYQK